MRREATGRALQTKGCCGPGWLRAAGRREGALGERLRPGRGVRVGKRKGRRQSRRPKKIVSSVADSMIRLPRNLRVSTRCATTCAQKAYYTIIGFVAAGRIRTCDLRVMSPTSYHCSTPRCWCKGNNCFADCKIFLNVIFYRCVLFRPHYLNAGGIFI